MEPTLSPYCKKLRSKKLAFRPGPPLEDGDILDASNRCWCDATKMTVGPDHDLVSPADCRADRSCFTPWIAASGTVAPGGLRP